MQVLQHFRIGYFKEDKHKEILKSFFFQVDKFGSEPRKIHPLNLLWFGKTPIAIFQPNVFRC